MTRAAKAVSFLTTSYGLVMEKTRLSSKGRIVLPASIRAARKWKSGQELSVENTAEGVLLRPAKPFPETALDAAIGCAGYKGTRRSLCAMEAAVLREARKRR